MSSVDGETKSLLDSTADYVSSKIFGPIYSIDESNADEEIASSHNNYEDASCEETNNSDVAFSSNFQIGNSKPVRDINEAQNGSLHMIASTLAKIANVKSTKGHAGDESDAVIEEADGNQQESLLAINNSDSMDHIVVDDGKEISIHAIRKTKATTPNHVEESTKEQVEPTTIDAFLNQDDAWKSQEKHETTALNNEIEASLHLDQPSSFADCICPFTSSYPVTEPTISPSDSPEESAAPLDGETPPLDVESTVDLGAIDTENIAPLDTMPAVSPSDIQALPFEVSSSKETKQVDARKDVTTLNKVESTAENSILEEIPASRPFSFLNFVVPLSPIPSLNHIEDATGEVNQTTGHKTEESNLEHEDENGDPELVVQENDTCTNKPINPPARWSIFTPFVTSYLDAHRDTAIHGKDPVGNQLVENGTDPVGAGPILFTNSIDKSITPPWDREDPPAAANHNASTITIKPTSQKTINAVPDVETPAHTDQNEPIENNDTENSPETTDHSDDVECTMKGPVERSVPVANSKSMHLSPPLAIFQDSKFTEKHDRCRRIIVLFLLFIGVLSVGVYYIIQNQSKNSSRVVSASQANDSLNTGNQNTTVVTPKTTKAPVASPTLSPSVAPLEKSVSLRPTKAPTQQPTLLPSNQPSNVGAEGDSNLNDNVGSVSSGDDDNDSGGDDASNTDDDGIGDDDDGTDDDGNDIDDDGNNNDDDTN